MHRILAFAVLFVSAASGAATDRPIAGFRVSAVPGEAVREQWLASGVRIRAIAPHPFDAAKPTQLILFATPNGNTIDQTLGCGPQPGLDWHFDIQHIAAQVRHFRHSHQEHNVVLACLEAEGLSWPAWKAARADGPAQIVAIVDEIRRWLPGPPASVILACHSGGGSFLFGFLDGQEKIPDFVDRFIFLDANYSYTDGSKHGDKLIDWLKRDPRKQLTVVAYDDRTITLAGKPVVGPEGGTFRATLRMTGRLTREGPLMESRSGLLSIQTAFNGQATFVTHANPLNAILHTVLVGEMNGLLYGLTRGDRQEVPLAAPRKYTKYIQPAPAIPERPNQAISGTAFVAVMKDLAPADREDAIARELLSGNLPPFLRRWQTVTFRAKDGRGTERTVSLKVMPDYLAIGTDADFVRMPMTPMTAARIADTFGCVLPTRKLVNEIHLAAMVKLEPIPLTKDRETVATFLHHHERIEAQRTGKPLGLLVSGIKKDVVVSNRLSEKPNKVAIFGWHKSDGLPIQDLTIVHRDTYVDYSHGIRLIHRTAMIDGKPYDLHRIAYLKDWHPLVSDEGPLLRPSY